MRPLYVLALLLLTSDAYLFANILDYGAVGDNRTDCTPAFRAALAAVAAAGGGQVLAPRPEFFAPPPST